MAKRFEEVVRDLAKALLMLGYLVARSDALHLRDVEFVAGRPTPVVFDPRRALTEHRPDVLRERGHRLLVRQGSRTR